MKKILPIFLLLISGFIYAEEASYSMNLKIWSHTLRLTNPSLDVTTTTSNSPIIGFSVRKGDYFASASFLLDSSYRYESSWLNRRDNDFSLGYRLTENISVVGGYRVASMSYSTQSSADKTTAYYVGVSGFKPISDKYFLYGNFQNLLNANISNDIDTFKDVRLNSYEVGAGYVLNKTAQLVLGYRQQNMSLYSNANSRQEYNYMGGLIGGFNINF